MYLNFIFKTWYTFNMIKIISDVGFCFGVKNAVEKLKEIKNDGGRIFLLHPLIHNALLNDKLLKENNATIFAGEDLKKEDTIPVIRI